MAFRKLVGSYKDYNLSTHVIEDGYLAVDVDTGSLRIGDGVTPGGTEVGGGGGSSTSLGDLTATGSTLSAPSNGDLTLQTAGTGVVIINDTFKIGSGASVTTILDEDDLSTDSATALATQQSIKAYVDNELSNVSVGDLSIIGSTIASPSNADLTLNSSNGNVVIEGIRVAGTTISTEDSSPGVVIEGNLLPSQDGVFQLGSSSKRWQTLFVAAETIDIGGATISSDGSGTIEIAAAGATLPVGSKLQNNPISILGATGKTAARPVQNVKVFVSDGSTSSTDTELLAKTADLTLEFNATVETIPVFTEAGQNFTLSNGDSLTDQVTDVTLFQF
jgi:hypothetical protein|tara:strand:+ start:596 stop:1594 length:999 start_codon:yes stop_codon:yes gene_type:complete